MLPSATPQDMRAMRIRDLRQFLIYLESMDYFVEQGDRTQLTHWEMKWDNLEELLGFRVSKTGVWQEFYRRSQM